MVARKAPGYRGNPRRNTPGLPGDSRRISGIMVPFGLSWSLWLFFFFKTEILFRPQAENFPPSEGHLSETSGRKKKTEK